MLLSSLVTLRHPNGHEPTAEDIFAAAPGVLFPDDLQNIHGADPNTTIIYQSRKYGPLEFHTADFDGEEQRRKFAHYLWNAGLLMAELVGGRPDLIQDEGRDPGVIVDEAGKAQRDAWWLGDSEDTFWNVQDTSVLELGAGVGLAGIASVLSGAKEVAITDYPAPSIIDTLKQNVNTNVPDSRRSVVRVEGHKWGDLSTPFAEQNSHRFDRILAADCFWMPGEHDNLALSMLHFLSYSADARILCIAGFHTGRAKLAAFYEEMVPKCGLEIEQIFEMDASGKRRPWEKERDSGTENVGERKKWLTVARLRRPAR